MSKSKFYFLCDTKVCWWRSYKLLTYLLFSLFILNIISLKWCDFVEQPTPVGTPVSGQLVSASGGPPISMAQGQMVRISIPQRQWAPGDPNAPGIYG